MYKNKLFKKVIISAAIVVILLVIETTILLNILSPTQPTTKKSIPTFPSGRILRVGGADSGNYIKINNAINSAGRGDTVYVYSGTYYENIVVDKPINLIGENKDTTIIDGGGSGGVVKIAIDNTILSNFTLRNGGVGQDHLNDAAIEITSNNNIILNTNCLSTNYGIWIRNSTGNIIRNNNCIAKYDGIWLMNSGNNLLRNNSMVGSSIVLDGSSLQDFIQDIDTSNTVNGKPVYYYKNQVGIKIPLDAGQVILVNCERCVVSGLEIYNVTDGIEIIYSKRNTIKNNKIIGTVDFGIRLVKSDYNIIENNICSDNPIGIGFISGGSWAYDIDADCRYNIIRKNTLSNNYYYGILLDSSDDNTISKNNFIGNGKNAFFVDSYNNKWLGNYWDNWIGVKHRLLGFLPKLVWGRIHLNLFQIPIPWPNIDQDPQREPYDF